MLTFRYLLILIVLGSFSLVSNAQADSLNSKDITLFTDSILNDVNSEFHYISIEKLLHDKDTSITGYQLLAYTRYKVLNADQNPNELDALSKELFELCEKEKYKSAIKLGKKILDKSPTNFTAHRELSLAYSKLDDEVNKNYHWNLTLKLVYAHFQFSDGSQMKPFNFYNFFEFATFYEFVYRCQPDGVTATFIDYADSKKLLGALKCYSSDLDEIIIQYCDLDHSRLWKEVYGSD